MPKRDWTWPQWQWMKTGRWMWNCGRDDKALPQRSVWFWRRCCEWMKKTGRWMWNCGKWVESQNRITNNWEE